MTFLTKKIKKFMKVLAIIYKGEYNNTKYDYMNIYSYKEVYYEY